MGLNSCNRALENGRKGRKKATGGEGGGDRESSKTTTQSMGMVLRGVQWDTLSRHPCTAHLKWGVKHCSFCSESLHAKQVLAQYLHCPGLDHDTPRNAPETSTGDDDDEQASSAMRHQDRYEDGEVLRVMRGQTSLCFASLEK